jgi:hypothetical protein
MDDSFTSSDHIVACQLQTVKKFFKYPGLRLNERMEPGWHLYVNGNFSDAVLPLRFPSNTFPWLVPIYF